MINPVIDNEHEQERGVRQALEACLQHGESLAAYTTGQVFGVTATAYHIGLTGDCLVFLPLKHGAPAAQAYGIQRSRVKSPKLKGSGLSGSRLELELSNDRLNFVIRGGRWRRRGKGFGPVGRDNPFRAGQ